MQRRFFFSICAMLLVLSACSKLESSKYRSKKNDTLATKEIAENVVIDYTDSGLLKAKIKSALLVAVKHVREIMERLKAICSASTASVTKIKSAWLCGAMCGCSI
jgi:hypothetical protein